MADVEDWVDTEVDAGSAAKSIRNWHSLLHSIMTYGQQGERLRVDDPCCHRAAQGGPQVGATSPVLRRRRMDGLPIGAERRRVAVAQLASFGWLLGRTRPAGWEHALARLDTKGIVRRANIDGLTGDWFVHADALDEPFTPRTTLLSPFDPLIHDRPRTEALFDFHYRLEMYVPRAKRQYGYFVLPILDGDRIAGRLDCRIDRNAARLDVPGIWAQPDPPDGAALRVIAALRQLATWLGAQSIAIGHVHCPDWADTFPPRATLPSR